MRTLLIHQFQVKPKPGEDPAACFEKLIGSFTHWIDGQYQPPKGRYKRLASGPLNWKGIGVELLGRDGHSLIIHRFQTLEAALFSIRWIHPHDDDTMDWRNNIQVALHGQDLEVSLEIGLIQKKMVLAPPFFTLRNPRVFGDILSNFACYSGASQITGEAQLVTLPGVPIFLEKVLLDSHRVLPVLVIAPIREGGYELDVNALAAQLKGLVRVVRLQDKWAAQHFSLKVGRTMGCYDGGARLYWPGFSLQDSIFRHPLYLRTRLRDLGFDRFSQMIFRKVADLTAFRHVEGQVIQAAKLQQELEQRAAQDKLREQVKQGELDMETLQERFFELQYANEDLRKQLKDKEEELEDVRGSFAAFSQAQAVDPGGTDKPPEIPEFESVKHVVGWCEEEFEATLIFHEKAKKLAEESPYQDLAELYRLFQCLDALVQKWQKDGSIGATWKDALREKSFDFKPNTSDLTRQKKWKGEYEAQYEGETVRLEEHVTIGVGQNPQSCLSVHWHRDEDRKKLLIGRCGKHASNSLS